MSITAEISHIRKDDQGVHFVLAPFPESKDPPGQPSLLVENATEIKDLEAFVGLPIWGGSRCLLHGEVVFAERTGYQRIHVTRVPVRSRDTGTVGWIRLH